jgi:hypothetical protein
VLAVAWWAPLAIVGGALAGAGIGYLLLAAAGSGRSRKTGADAKLSFERAESTSDLKWNPWAFFVVGAGIAIIVGLSVGLSIR